MISERETLTVVAALRLWQLMLEGHIQFSGPGAHIAAVLRDHDATAGRSIRALDQHEVDALCQRLTPTDGAET